MTLRFVLGRPCIRFFGFGVSFDKQWRIEHLIWRNRWIIDCGWRVEAQQREQPPRNYAPQDMR